MHLRLYARPLNLLFNKIISYTAKMSEATALERIKSNAMKAEKDLEFVKKELASIVQLHVNDRIAKLKTENRKLNDEVSKLIRELTALEISKGIPQIPVPGARKIHIEAPKEPVAQPEKVQKQTEKVTLAPTPSKPANDKKKEKTPAKEKAAKAPKESAPEPDVDVGRLDFRVGKIVEVGKHPDADSLYVEKVDCGEAKPRTVVSGLVKYVPLEEMQNRMVVVLCNLKPAKMRGVLSEAMVMCASTPEHVEVLSPPEGALPGDLVHCDGFPRAPDAQLNPKKKIFETVAPDLLTSDTLVACYKGNPLHVPGKGNVVAKTLKNVNVK